jgi:hypothetical protein
LNGIKNSYLIFFFFKKYLKNSFLFRYELAKKSYNVDCMLHLGDQVEIKISCHKIHRSLASSVTRAAFSIFRIFGLENCNILALTGTGGAVCKGATPSVEQ